MTSEELSNFQYPFVCHKGEVITLKRSDKIEVQYFGGPRQFQIKGVKHGKSKLHQIGVLLANHLDIEGGEFYSDIPLYYGMRFDGCEISYSVTSYGEITVHSMDPQKSSSDWPYEGYPDLLPYIPLVINSRFKMDEDEIDDCMMQEFCSDDDDVITVVIPPIPDLGVSLWGVDGDLEEVQIIFEINKKTGIIRAYNACT